MDDPLYDEVSDIEAKIEENRRLAGLLADVQRSLATEAARLISLKQRVLARQKEVMSFPRATRPAPAHAARPQPQAVDARVLDFLVGASAGQDQAHAAGPEKQAAAKERPTPADYAGARQQVAEGKRAARDAARSAMTAAREASAAPSPPPEPKLATVEEPSSQATPAEYAGARQQVAEGKRAARDAARSAMTAAREASAAPSPHPESKLATVEEPSSQATPAEYADARQQVAEGKRAARVAARSLLTAAREATTASFSHAEPELMIVEEPPAPAAPAAESAPGAVGVPQPHAEAVHAAEVEAAEPAGPDAELRADEKRLTEALEAGRLAMSNIDRCKELLHSVAQGGALHTIASAMFSKSPDHAKLDEARQAAHEAQENLHKFREHVTALRHRLGGKADAGELAGLADRLLGHVTGESEGEPGILHSLEGLRETYHDLRGLCVRLQREAIAVRARLAAMERARRTGT
jgi:hypothetical protein